MNRYRSGSGNQPIEKNQSARPVLRVLRHGGVVGILADQNAALEDSLFVDFFGTPAATTTGIARIARHTGAAVVPVYSYWDAALQKYRLRYEPALSLPRTDDEEADIRAYTILFNQTLENCIRKFPDQWFWVHRRWKTRPIGEQPIYPDQMSSAWPASAPGMSPIEGQLFSSSDCCLKVASRNATAQLPMRANWSKKGSALRGTNFVHATGVASSDFWNP